VKLLATSEYPLGYITNSPFVYHQSSSDVILLQEWWFDEKFTEVFDGILGGQFDRVAERRPGSINNSVYTYLQQSHDLNIIRDDGMACLVNKKGKLKLVSSSKVLTGPERIAQIIHCKERDDTSSGRDVANTHLSFPKDEDQNKNDRRQAYEINLIQRALSKMSRSRDNEALELICGDFNSEPNGLASTQLELRDFVNCASIKGEQLGVTHYAHTGQEMSADHIFVRQARLDQCEKQGDEVTFDRSVLTSRRKSVSIGYQDPLSLGCIDTRGTQVINIRREDIRIKGRGVLSDHTPVTATLRWPKFRSVGELSDPFVNFSNSTMPLDPLSLCASEL
jgi:endonuclease/exonuclease/phosphatase family metal-dependent hydrolase